MNSNATRISPSDPQYEDINEAQTRLCLFVNRHVHHNLRKEPVDEIMIDTIKHDLTADLRKKLDDLPPQAFRNVFK